MGRIAKPHGVHGDVLAEILTDFPERLADGVRFGLGPADGPREFFEVHRVRLHKRRWLLSVNGIRDRDGVEGWRSLFMFLPEQSFEELPPGYYYEHHLTGLGCRAADGAPLGEVIGIDRGVGQDRLIIRRGGREFLVPYVPEIVIAVDLEEGIVTLDPPAGLLDDDAVKA